MSFCTKCGNEKVNEWTGEYSESDGTKVMREICPVSPCEHSGHIIEEVGSVKPKDDWKYGCKIVLECKRCGVSSYKVLLW